MNTPAPTRRPWWSRLRFRLRTLIVLVIPISAALAWFVHGARSQRAAVAAIEKAGGRVRYDWEWKNGNTIPGGAPWAPKWLVEQVGIDYFGSVVFVDLNGTKAAEALPHVKNLGRLEWLLLIGSKLGPRGLAPLEGLRRLQWLDLSYSSVADADLAHLKGLNALQVLFLHNTQSTDAGVVHLKDLTSLRVLTLDDTRIRGLNSLKGLVNLQTLHLGRTAISNYELRALRGCANLRFLSVPGQSITDDTVEELRQALPDLNVAR